MSIECDELYFVGPALGVDVHDGTYIARAQTVGDIFVENHSIVLMDHHVTSTAIGRHQSRLPRSTLQNPDRSHSRRASIRPRQLTFNSVPRALLVRHRIRDHALPGMAPNRVRELLRSIDTEAQPGEECGPLDAPSGWSAQSR